MRMKFARYGLLAVLAAGLTATAVHAADADDAKAAKSEAWSYKNGADQWKGLMLDWECQADSVRAEAAGWRQEWIDGFVWTEGHEVIYLAMLANGQEDYDAGYAKRVTGDVHYAAALGYYNGGVNDMIASRWDGAVEKFTEASKPMPAQRFQSASQQYAEAIDKYTLAKADWDLLLAFVYNP